MIVFIDPFNSGLSHVPVNVGIIETALAVTPGREITIAAERGHLEGINDLVESDIRTNAKLVPIAPPPPGSRFMTRLLADFHNLDAVFRFSPGGGTLILADLAPATLYALRLNVWRHPKAFRQFVVVLHGNAAEIAGWRARNPLIRATQLRSAMTVAPAVTRFVVLEDSIRRALIRIAPEFKRQLVTLPHPLPTTEGNAMIGAPEESVAEMAYRPIRIAFLGAAQAKKGFDTFLELANNLSLRQPGKVEFHAIGWLPPENAGLDLNVLARKPSNKKLSRAEFLDAVASIDYVCMPYSQELYQYSASGTLLDAVAAGKPLVALRSPILNDLNEAFGDLGELADSPEQLQAMIEELVLNPSPAGYQQQVEAMLRLRQTRAPRALLAQWNTFCPADPDSCSANSRSRQPG